MTTKDFKTYCSYAEFEAEFNDKFCEGDYMQNVETDEGTAIAWYNVAGCVLALWFEETQEYQTF